VTTATPPAGGAGAGAGLAMGETLLKGFMTVGAVPDLHVERTTRGDFVNVRIVLPPAAIGGGVAAVGGGGAVEHMPVPSVQHSMDGFTTMTVAEAEALHIKLRPLLAGVTAAGLAIAAAVTA